VANAEQNGTKDQEDVELTIMATFAQDMSMWLLLKRVLGP
jgi:hypothetical protein